MITYHTVWPEGRPLEAEKTMSWWKAQWIVFKLQCRYLFNDEATRRIRHGRSSAEYVDPVVAEKILQETGAIPPPGGWKDSLTITPQRESIREGMIVFDNRKASVSAWKPPRVIKTATISIVDYTWPHCAPLKNGELNSFFFSGTYYRKEFLGDHWEYVVDVIKPDFKDLFDDLRTRLLTPEEYLKAQRVRLELESAFAAQDQLRINAAVISQDAPDIKVV